MRLSTVIPAFNEEKLLPRTLEAIAGAAAALAPHGISHEVIVCDNNSTDATAEIARKAGATVVFEPVNQISRARNAGAAAATGDWLLFLDADSAPCPGLFGELAAALRDDTVAGGGATLRQDGKHAVFEASLLAWNAYARLFSCAAGAFLFCRAAAFRDIGGFSRELFAGEELDMSSRLKKWGRPRGQKLRVLHRHPLLTSSRKTSMYSLGTFARFMARSVLTGGRNLRRKEECGIWYEGKR